MNEKIEKLIKEVGINEVESILQEIKSKVNVKEELKKDFIDLLTGCTISFNYYNIEYKKDTELLFYYNKSENDFYFNYNIWSNFEDEYNLYYQELKDLLVDIVKEVLNYKCATPELKSMIKNSVVEKVLN